MLDAGFLVVAAAGALIIVNALVLSVIERTGEIGAMRAIGASRNFVLSLFMAESLVLTLSAAAAGSAVGAIAAAIIRESGIPLSNQLLATLFGSSRLVALVTPRSIAYDFAVAAAVGVLSAIYPVRLALRIQPVRAAAVE